jgi:DNA-binding transcriptional ArsR family regulator
MRARDDMAVASQEQQPDTDIDTGDQLALAADTLGHLAHPTRLHLLRLLAAGEQDVNTLTGQVDASRSSVSQHLGRLRMVGLVHIRRDGRRVLYRIASDHLAGLVEEAYQFAGHLVNDIPHHRPSPH